MGQIRGSTHKLESRDGARERSAGSKMVNKWLTS